MRSSWFTWSMVVVVMLGCANLAMGQAAKADAKEKNLVDTIKATDNLKEFAKLIDAADLAKTLSGKDAYTVFAPTDEAIAKDKAAIDDLMKPANKAKLVRFVKNHIVAGKDLAAGLQKKKDVKTLAGTTLVVTFKDGKLMIEKANVTKEVMASNGVIHVVDGALMPPAEKDKKDEPKKDTKKDEPKKDDKKK